MEGRKSNKEIIDSIIKSLLEGPKSINEIAADTEINWESVRNYLEILKSFGSVDEKSIGKKRVFSARKILMEMGKSSEADSETLFGIPVRKEDDNIINYLFMKIRAMWISKTGKPPGKTQMQKAVAKVDKICELGLPVVWYKFGKMCIKTYDPSKEYNFSPVKNKELDVCIEKVVEEIRKHETVRKLKEQQYHEEKNTLYETKEEIMRLLYYRAINRETINKMSMLLVDLIAYIPQEDEKGNKIARLSAEFSGIVIQLLNSNSEEKLSSIRRDIINAFEDLWTLIACYCLYISLKRNPRYNIENLFDYIRYHFNNQVFFVREHVLNLADLIERVEPEDKEYKALKELQGSVKKEAKETTKEQKKKMTEEMLEKKESTDIFRKSGLDD